MEQAIRRFAPIRLEVGVGPVPAKEPAHRPEGRRRYHEDQAQGQNGLPALAAAPLSTGNRLTHPAKAQHGS